jgi:hypothetical protein
MENIDEALKMIMRPLMVSIMKQFGFKRDPNIREELRAEIQAAVESVLRKHDVIVENQSGRIKMKIETFENFSLNENVKIPQDLDGIFVFEKKFPFGLPDGVADYYVSRKDGKIGTASWNSFESLIKENPGIKFGTYANSKRISIYESLKNGDILVYKEVYLQ